MRIKVLQVTESLDSGGREAFVMNLYRNINREKFQFDFFTLKEEEEFYTTEIKEMKGRIFSARTFSEKKGMKRFIKKNYYLYKIMKENKYSVIHIHACTPLDYIKVLFAKLARVNTIIMHSHSSYYLLDSKLKRITSFIMKKMFSDIPNYRIACSEEAAQFLFSKKNIDLLQYSIVNNSIDLKKYYFNLDCRDKERKLLNIKNEIVIGHIGRFSSEKNHDFIIRAFEKISFNDDNIILILVGDGELKEQIIELIIEKNLEEKIRILPPIKDIYKLYQVMDIFWFPSIHESFGMVALEAQVSGLKVLTSNTIPKKICLTNECEMLPLEEEIWCKKTLYSIKKLKRKNFSSSKIFKQYDLEIMVNFFENLYCKEIK